MTRRLRIMLALVLLLALTTAVPAAATLVIEQVSDVPGECDWPAVANSTNGVTLIAWVSRESGPMGDMDIVYSQFVHSKYLGPDVPGWTEPVSHGPGTRPAVCWSREGFTLAMASGEFVVVYQTDLEFNWDLENFDVLTVNQEAFGVEILDMWGNASDSGAGAHVFLSMGGTSWLPEVQQLAYCARRTAFGWENFELVADGDAAPFWPQVSFGIGGYGPLARVYYVTSVWEAPGLVYRTRQTETGWDDPQPVPGPVGSEFDVVHWGAFDRSVLGCGIPPTCPCNTIHYIEYLEIQGWQEPLDLTVEFGEFDWPQSPNISADEEERIHAFWYQRASDHNMVTLRCTLEYWVREGEVWIDEGDELYWSQIWPSSSRVAMGLRPGQVPVMAWAYRDTIEGEPQPKQIWIARREAIVDVPEGEVPAAAMTVKAYPNPFNPSTTIEYVLPAAGPVRVSVVDAGGRHVATLFSGEKTAGRHALAWDGAAEGGRRLPSGTYLVRVEAAGEVRTGKISLVK